MDSQPEELGLELILKGLNEELDPDELVEHYQALSDKYLEEAKELLKKGDLVQASEKFWGATASAIKMVGAKRGLKLKKHGSLWSLVDTLAKESRDRDILRFFGEANTLHRYENEMTETAVKWGAPLKVDTRLRNKKFPFVALTALTTDSRISLSNSRFTWLAIRGETLFTPVLSPSAYSLPCNQPACAFSAFHRGRPLSSPSSLLSYALARNSYLSLRFSCI